MYKARATNLQSRQRDMLHIHLKRSLPSILPVIDYTMGVNKVLFFHA